MSAPAAALCRTPKHTVALPQIPEALRGLWRACSAATNADAEGNVARSLAINFVGVADAAGESALRAAVDRLQHRTPCRAFLLLIDPSAGKPVAEVTATTRAHGSTQDIVLEEIAVRLPESGFAQVPGLVRPLLVNDLPNHLFWATTWPRSEPHFDELARLCDHVVVDTRSFLDPSRELGHLAARRRGGQRLTDLTWLRLRPWRRALAEAFERIPWRAGTPTDVVIQHGREAMAAALLLAQWLQDKLHAKVRLEGATGDASAPCPSQVDLRAGDCEVQLLTIGGHVAVHVTTPEYCYLPFKVPVSRGRDGDLLAAAIDLG